MFRIINVSSSDNRELQIRKALSTSSSRQARTDINFTSSSRLALEVITDSISRHFDKLNDRFLALLLFTTLLFSFQLFPQEAINSQYSHIKQLIISKQLNKAREEIRLAMAGNENDPTLNLYQTELWIVEADSYYASGQYKYAIEIYEKAIERYPSNPMVKLKYEEMVKKRKGLNQEAKENKPVNSFPIQALGLQGGLSQNSEVLRDSAIGSTQESIAMTKTDYLLTILCIQNFLLIVFLFRRLPKRY